MRDQGLTRILADINEVPLLTAEQEIELAKRVQRGDLAGARAHDPREPLGSWSRSRRTTSTAGSRSWT